VTRKRTGRGHHHLPKIKECLSKLENWIKLTSMDQYEFPGFESGTQNLQTSFSFVDDCRKRTFAANTLPHFICDDNQLSE
jgi:expansin (peptidoglycan-binding protein)